MGACLSTKKSPSSSSSSATTVPRNPTSVLSTFSVALSSTAQASTVVVPVLDPKPETKPKKQQLQQKPVEEHESAAPAKKEVFLIKHRKSHDERDRNAKQSLSSSSNPDPASEHDEHSESVPVPSAQIRTSSCTKEEVDAILIQCGRLSRSSSGKAASSSAGRRYSGSKRSFDFDEASGKSETPATEDTASEKRVRERRRHSPSPQGRRRRTPSRERERESDNHHPQRSSSRERRVSRSPGRRNAESAAPPPDAASVARPGKMVSVPAKVSGGDSAAGTVKRVLVKRNVASPRAQSPAKAKPEPAILSRSSSRKAEVSPFRRNPLSEIDSNRSQSRGRRESEGAEETAQVQKPNSVTSHRSNKQQQAATVETTVVIDTKPQSLTRTRSARRSRDFDFNSEAMNATPSYTRLLLEDINNFHQKNAPSPLPVTLPACVGKACSILEAVADLNNNSNISGSSSTFSEDQYSKTYNNLGGPKDPFVESEIGCDDLNEPSFHKYVTVRRGGGTAVDAIGEDQESSGSNSFVGGGSNGQLSGGNWGLSPSSWEPNSADSTDCWTSRSREDDRLCSGGVKKRESGIGRGRLGAAKGLYPTPAVVVADSTRS